MPDLITLGETSAVFVAKEIGRMRYSSEFKIRPGGAEATVAVGVVRLGHAAGWISRLGDDEIGNYLLSFIKGEGVDVSRVALCSDNQTALFLRERLPKGEARHFYYRKDSAFSRLDEDSIDVDYVTSAKLIHLSGITPAISQSCKRAVLQMISIANKKKIPVIFDPNMRKKLWSSADARDFFKRIYSNIEYLLPGIEDFEGIYDTQASDIDIIKKFLDFGCKNVILKCGPRGAIVGKADGTIEAVPHEPVESPEDLMGAGDAFAAGFISALLRGENVVQAAHRGNCVARFAIQLPGNIESMPYEHELTMATKGHKAIHR